MRGAANIIAASGGSIQTAAGIGSDFQDAHPVNPTMVFLGSATATVAGGAAPTNAVITLNQAVPGIGASAAIFDDEFVSAPWQAHRTWQSGDMWAYTATFDTAGNGLQEGPTWWANPIATPAAATVYPAPSGSVMQLGLMATPANTPNPAGGTITQATIGTLINNQNSAGLRLFGYHELRLKVPKVPGFLFQWDIEDYPNSPTWTTEIDLIIYTDASGLAHVIFQISAPSVTTIYQTTALDITQFHTYGLNWQADHITAYIDGTQVGAIVTPGGDYQSQPMFAYLLTSDASYQGFNSPAPASLPAFASIDYYRVFANIPSTAGTVLVHAYNAGCTANTVSDTANQTWLRHPDARIGSPPYLTALAYNTKPMPQGSTITVGFTNPGTNTQAEAAAWYVPFVNATAFGSLVNVGQSGTPPNAPTITVNPTSSSTATVSITMPTVPPALDNGAVQVQYRTTGSTTWNSAPNPPQYITPDHGSILDAFGNVWTVSSAGAAGQTNTTMVNGNFANGWNVPQVLQIGGTIYQVNSAGSWFGYTPTGPISAAAAGSLAWTALGTTSPLQTPGVAVSGITGLSEDFSAYVTNSAGSGALSAVSTVTMPLGQTAVTISDTGGSSAWMNHYPWGGSEYTLAPNNEAEYYASATRTPGFSPFSGKLTITADTVQHTVFNPLSLPYNSGAIVSATEVNGAPAAGMFAAQYFYYAVNCKIPAGAGLWPAIWAMPLNPTPGTSSWDGEIDVLESIGNVTQIYQTVHYAASDALTITALGSNSVVVGPRQVRVTVTDFSQNFHEYAVDWQPSGITWYVDGVATASYPATAPFTSPNNPFYILLNLAVGGAGSWPGPPNAQTVFPAQMPIQYIRIAANRAAYNAGNYTDYIVNAGIPGTPAIAQVSVASTSAVVSITPPTTGGALDRGKYQVQYITGTASYTDNGPAIQYITPNSGSLTDPFGNVWTISAAGAQGQTNTVMCNGAYANGYNVPQMMMLGGTVYQVNASNQWFSYTATAGSVVGANVVWSAASSPLSAVSLTGMSPTTAYQVRAYDTNSGGSGTPSAPITVTTTAVQAGSGFFTTTSQSQRYFLDPNGNAFTPKGVHSWRPSTLTGVDTNNMAANGGPIFTLFPNTKIIRAHSFIADGLWTPAQFQPIVNYLTARQVILIIENGDYDKNYEANNELATALPWYQSIANAFQNNPYVWIESPNEPNTSFSYAQTVYQQVYTTVRNAGYKQPFGCCGNYSNYPSAATLAGMHNVWVDCHMYVGSNGSTTQTYINAMNSRSAPMRGVDADGITVPICTFEFGDAENGSSQDFNYGPCLTQVLNGTIVTAGWAGFCMNGNMGFSADVLNYGNTTNGFGTIMPAYM